MTVNSNKLELKLQKRQHCDVPQRSTGYLPPKQLCVIRKAKSGGEGETLQIKRCKRGHTTFSETTHFALVWTSRGILKAPCLRKSKTTKDWLSSCPKVNQTGCNLIMEDHTMAFTNKNTKGTRNSPDRKFQQILRWLTTVFTAICDHAWLARAWSRANITHKLKSHEQMTSRWQNSTLLLAKIVPNRTSCPSL